MSAIRFASPTDFHKTLYARVRKHLKSQGIPKAGGSRILLKTAFIMSMYVGSYIWLVFFAESVWAILLSAFILSQAIVLIGFNVMHDAGHGAFSSKRWVNTLAGLGLDLVGGSQWLWSFKHGVLHHKYTNIESFDDDLDSGGLIRMHPDQEWKPFHRFQAFYTLPLYSFLYTLWTVKDFAEFFGRHVGRHKTQTPSKRDTAIFLAFKANFVLWGLVVPMLLHPWYWVLAIYLGIQMVIGVILALVFQLAHVVDGVAMPSLKDNAEGSMPDQWAAHQIKTTANFALNNPFVRWYTGGLNSQIEHHLFTGISHVRYRHIQPIVRETCAEFGIPYQCYPTVRAAFMAHMRQLVAMSRKAPEAIGDGEVCLTSSPSA